MRVTEQVVVVEAVIGGLLTDARSWIMWSDARGKRDHAPAFIACHMPSRLVVAVYVRPRKLYPSEMPNASWLPAGWISVVWHPAMSAEIRSWLTVAVGEPPGVLSTAQHQSGRTPRVRARGTANLGEAE